ncbi:MAG: hypothetical protein IPH48_11105 [bacterium]|nr:hypothetical protein [bacterium]
MKSDRYVIQAVIPLILFGVLLTTAAWAYEPPVVSNVNVQQRAGTQLVDITYDLADVQTDTLIVRLYFSANGGATWTHACRHVSGHVGLEVPTGPARQIVWDAGADLPGVNLAACRLRVLADQWVLPPFIESVRRLAGSRADTLAFTPMDTIPFGVPFGFTWTASSSAAGIYPPQVLAELDPTPPVDGIVGYQFGCSPTGCAAGDADCWLPRRFDEATGDSVPYFGPASSAWFSNDDTGADIRQRRLASGVHQLSLNAQDVDGTEAAGQRTFAFVVNHDPNTIILDGQSDWAHPDDPETYPYYIELNDPAGVHHPFQSGDRIPDRTYVVAKALARDDARDVRLDPSSATGITGFVQGLRQNLTGGVFPFASQAAAVGAQPTWGSGVDGWYGDTLGFLTAPRSYMTINMQGIDEHGRRDGTPAALGFDVGHEPCLQCIELLPRPDTSVPAFDNSVPCVEDTSAAYLAGHPCLGGVTQLRVSPASAGGPDMARDLQMVPGTAFMLVNRASGIVTNTVTWPSRSDSVSSHILVASRFRYAVVFNGMDDPRESWPQAARRIGGVAYRVSSACDPGNTIRDGIGSDNLEQPTWGQPATGTGLVISPIDGTWKFEVDVFVPTHLLQLGAANFRMYLNVVHAAGDAQVVDFIWDAVTRQFGAGWVDAVVLDQTSCTASPVRPAMFNFFRNVRPEMTLGAGQTWRDCDLLSSSIQQKLPLWQGAMSSLGGVPVRKHFQLTLHPQIGADIGCTPD